MCVRAGQRRTFCGSQITRNPWSSLQHTTYSVPLITLSLLTMFSWLMSVAMGVRLPTQRAPPNPSINKFTLEVRSLQYAIYCVLLGSIATDESLACVFVSRLRSAKRLNRSRLCLGWGGDSWRLKAYCIRWGFRFPRHGRKRIRCGLRQITLATCITVIY